MSGWISRTQAAAVDPETVAGLAAEDRLRHLTSGRVARAHEEHPRPPGRRRGLLDAGADPGRRLRAQGQVSLATILAEEPEEVVHALDVERVEE